MPSDIDIVSADRQVFNKSAHAIPAVIEEAGPRAQRRFVEFFTANIANANTRAAYYGCNQLQAAVIR